MRLRNVALLAAPFALIALVHHLHFTTAVHLGGPVALASGKKLSGARRASRRKPHAAIEVASQPSHAAGGRLPADEGARSAGAGDESVITAARAASHVDHMRVLSPNKVRAADDAGMAKAAAAPYKDHAREYPPPTLSTERLLDGSENWLPVPDAETDASDVKWREAIRPDMRDGTAAGCPPGRRPFHVILTAQASLYQEWQTKIMYYHFRKVQRLNPCTEMTGFTRLLASKDGQPDGLMESIPTIAVPQAGHDKTRGFQVINRPASLVEMLKRPEWRTRIREQYVMIAETDHLLRRDIPNRATPALNVAFFFPYMSPVPKRQTNVIKRYFDGDPKTVQPVGPSPALMHVDNLVRLAPVWFDLSVDLKHDAEADSAFGWVLEMWGYSLASARLGIKHFVWQQLQIEPSASWHQDVSSEAPYIYHYTFGVEYSSEGFPMPGAVGEWSLDKRHYFGAYPPRNLDPPPRCAKECAWVWWRMFNEATEALHRQGQWPENTGGNTLSFNRGRASADTATSPLAEALVRSGPWKVNGKGPLLFYKGGRVHTPWGIGSWHASGERMVELSLCGSMQLTFDGTEHEFAFGRTRRREFNTNGKGALDPNFHADRVVDDWDEEHPAVSRVLGVGPWAWAGIAPLAFLGGGKLHTPWGAGQYVPLGGTNDTLVVTFAGAVHTVVVSECYTFASTRKSDGKKVEGGVQLGQPARSCTF